MVQAKKILLAGVVGTFTIIYLVYILDIKNIDIKNDTKCSKSYREDAEYINKYDDLAKLENNFEVKAIKENRVETNNSSSNKRESDIIKNTKAIIKEDIRKPKYLYIDESGNISPDSLVLIDRYISNISSKKDIYLEVEGHSASKGSEYLTKKASIDSAQVVANYLRGKIPDKKIVVTGYGDTYPIIDDKNDIRNSRVEIKIRRR